MKALQFFKTLCHVTTKTSHLLFYVNSLCNTLMKVYFYNAKLKIKIALQVQCYTLSVLHTFCVAVQYTQTFSFYPLHSFHYSLFLHVSATGYDHHHHHHHHLFSPLSH
jgi:hypothetical protein